MRRVLWSQNSVRGTCPPGIFVACRLSSRYQRAGYGAQRRLTTSAHRPTSGTDEALHRPRIIFSGIQPTGVAHLGNYLGAIQPWVKLQQESPAQDKLFFSIVDLHSLTSRSQQPAERRLAKKQTLAILLAAGLNPERCTLFHQSSVPQHAELHWILSCEAGMGWLSRIPTWKDKLLMEVGRTGQDNSNINLDISSLLQPSPNPKHQEKLKLGLFAYPVLQAADILLYHATHVPVGADQLINIEFARGAATTFNSIYGQGGAIDPQTGRKMKGREILTSPEAIVGQAKRVMSLTEAGKKMSKSSPNEKGRILVTDSEAEIRKKFQGALTDSIDDGVTYDAERRPGVSNLLDIIAHVEQINGQARSPVDIAQDFAGLHVKGSVLRLLKERAANVVNHHLRPLREQYEHLMGTANGRLVDDVAEKGRQQAESEAKTTIATVRHVIGL